MASIVASAKRTPSNKRLLPAITIADNETEIFVVRWSPDGTMLAAGAGDGSISVFNGETGKMAYELQPGNSGALPATSIRFRPSNDAARTKNVLVTTSAAGTVQHWHVTSGKCLHTLDEGGSVMALDYRPDGLQFATGGRDKVVRLYDEATKALTCELKGGLGYGDNVTTGHSNQIFSLKYHPTDENCLISGGWDNTIQVWDCRAGHAVKSIYGPHLCGDALDLVVDPSTGKTTVLAGSWRPQDPLEMFDLDTGKCIEQVAWRDSLLASQPCMLYAAQFSQHDGRGQFIAAGGSGANEARVFERGVGPEKNTSLVGTVAGMKRGVFGVAWSPVRDRVALGTGDGTIRILDVVKRGKEELENGESSRLINVRVEADENAQPAAPGAE